MKPQLLARAAAAIATFACLAAMAQAPYPSKTVTLIVPYSPGGLPDTVARVVGQKLSDKWGQACAYAASDIQSGLRLGLFNSIR